MNRRELNSTIWVWGRRTRRRIFLRRFVFRFVLLIQPTKLILRFSGESSNTYRYASGGLRNIDTENNSVLQEEANIFRWFDLSTYGSIKWILGFKWYVVVSVFIFAAFIFFQIEESVKSQKRNHIQKSKEGMETKQNERTETKGIIRSDKNKLQTKKRVSFSSPPNFAKTIQTQMTKIYNWWILPITLGYSRSWRGTSQRS